MSEIGAPVVGERTKRKFREPIIGEVGRKSPLSGSELLWWGEGLKPVQEPG